MPDEGNQNNVNNQQGGDGQGSGTPPTFDDWLKGQDDTVKGLIDSHISGLQSALKSERETRKDLEKQVRDLAGKAEKGSEAEKQLTELADKLSATDKRVTAYESLSAAGCSNLKLAWLAASESGLIDGQGNVSMEKLKSQFPELFKTATSQPKGNAGSGAGQTGSGGNTMNDWIRRQAGRA